MKNLIDRSAAREAGLTRYFTGKPCKHGHIAERYVTGAQCCECLAPTDPEKRAINSAKACAYSKKKHAEAAIAKGRPVGRPGRMPKYATQEERLAARRQALRDWRERDPEHARAQHAAYMRKRTAARAIAEGRIPNLLGHKASWTVAQHEQYAKDAADGGAIFRSRVIHQNARAKRMGIEGRITVRDVLDAYETQAGNCAYCSKELGAETPEIDHWFPMSRGGVNMKHNIRLLHKTCNIMKHNHLPEEIFGGVSINWLAVNPEMACFQTPA